MYHPPQQPQEPTQLARLSLAKFSHTTTSLIHSGPLNWSHIIGNGDIIGVLESHSAFGPASARVLLKVFRDYEILEEVDLTHHIQEATNSPVKPIFAAIVKLPCLAVKYPKADQTSVRRFQVKFASDRDYYTTLAILSSINCPFSESSVGLPQTGRKLTSSSQWRSGSRPSGPGTGETLHGGPGAVGFPAVGGFIAPSYSPVADLPGAPSITIGSMLRPSSSSTSHTLTDLPPPSHNNQVPGSNIKPLQSPLPLESHVPGKFNAVEPPSRPTTACHDSQTLDQLLPPKRDLPFTKPAPKKARTSKAQTNKTTNYINEQPQPQSSQAQAQPNNPPSRAPLTTNNVKGANRSLTSLPLPNTQREEPIVHPAPQHDAFPNASPVQPALHMPAAAPVQQQQLQADPKGITIPAPVPIHRSNATTTSLAVNSLPQPQDRAQNQSHHQQQITTDLASYTTAPSPDRITRLENWICEHIQDEDFLRLCQDVEGVWMRFAFGR